MVHVVTDSTTDLTPALLERYDIRVVPFIVRQGDREYLDGIDIDAAALYHLVAQNGELPRTSAPPIAAYREAFDQPGEVVFIGIGSALSAGQQNARLAAEQFPDGKIRLVDSRNLSSGAGHLVLRAAELAEQGLSAADIQRTVQELASHVRTSFVVDTLQYLYMGGRCSALENVVGSLLKIRPVIEVRPDGTLGVREKVHGGRRRTLQAMLDDLQQHLDVLDRRRIFVTHSLADDADWLAEQVQALAEPQELLVTPASCTISSHCGPKTVGILYMTV